MAERACVKRLQKEYRALCKEPVPNIVARPSPSDILEWHYVLEGCEGTPFAGGYYYGNIKFPPEYPYKPPAISILTGLLSFMMDNSPTTGSVKTTVAEKERHAKASLAFNCKNPTFKKLFPEYVEKYEQQQIASQPVAEREPPMATQVENSSPLLEKNINPTNEDENGVVDRPQQLRRQRKPSFPVWLLLLLFSIFGVVMALPLLHL